MGIDGIMFEAIMCFIKVIPFYGSINYPDNTLVHSGCTAGRCTKKSSTMNFHISYWCALSQFVFGIQKQLVPECDTYIGHLAWPKHRLKHM